MKIDTIFVIKTTSFISLGVNFLTLVLGIVYISTNIYSALWYFFGVLLIIVLALNFFLVYFVGENVNEHSKEGNYLNILGYIYLVFSILAVFSMNMGNLLISMTYSNSTVTNLGSYFLLLLGYLGMIGLGGFYSFKIIINLKNEKIWMDRETITLVLPSKKRKRREVIKLILLIFSTIGLGVGLFSSLTILFGSQIRILGFFGVGMAQFGLSWAFIVVCCTIILLKIGWIKNTKFVYPLLIFTFLITTVNLLPFLATPFSIRRAESNFNSAFNPAFGGNWRAHISPEEEEYFLKYLYYLPLYFLGEKPKDCTIIRDVLYFNGSESSYDVDKDILLHYDVYLPPTNKGTLPGNNSILIRIHGGGWSFGDKGLINMLQMNKYFASQGYIVFDIQYGLFGSRGSNPFTPEYVKGDFTKEDLIRHIGNLTFYLVENAGLYGANLDSVFLSGGSAGGHLACAVALGTASGSYPHIFSPNITIKGLIPFYPANNINENSDPFVNPALMVEVNSPPCLIFQGTQDGLVLPKVSDAMLQTYLDKGNTNCAILSMLFAGHANDLYFSGYYNHVFLYFMERFMFLFR